MICKRMKDPAGVECRKGHVLKQKIYRSEGSFDWSHVDEYNEVKTFKVAIHGCNNEMAGRFCGLRRDTLIIIQKLW